MNRKKVLAILAAAMLGTVTILAGGCGKQDNGKADKTQETTQKTERDSAGQSGELEDGKYLLTVNGYGVTEEEFLMFLRDQKAVTTNYYWTNYKMETDDAFWRTEVDGQTPLEYAKDRALTQVTEAKVEFILASEKDILEYKDYDEMMKDMEKENKERAEKKDSGETFYGVEEYSPFTYYQYLSGGARAELENRQIEKTNPSKEELETLYEEYKETFSLGAIYKYTVHYADGTTETVEQNTREIGKGEEVKEDLIYNYFPVMQPGQSVDYYIYDGREASIEFNGVESLGYASFEEAEKSLRAFYAKSEVAEWIENMTKDAKIVIDEERYDALEMP